MESVIQRVQPLMSVISGYFASIEESIDPYIQAVSDFIWGPFTLIPLLGIGLILSIGLKFMPILKIGQGFKLLWQGRSSNQDQAGISPFNALMTSLSATIGTGNIAGVATAIAIGGPGALFWMVCVALLGMATKYAEAVCAVQYREKDESGHYVGGPMYYIKNGLSKHWGWLGTAFAIIAALASFGIGNTVQANSIAGAMAHTFGLSHGVTAVILMILVGLVLIGGIKRISDIAGKLVPFMAIAYIVAGIAILIVNAEEIPHALALIVNSAFTPLAAQGGFAGSTLMLALRMGVARGIFSNEAGLGSAPIAHAASQNKNPVTQGMIAMLGTFIDTIVICSITGLAIVTSGLWDSGANGSALTAQAFEASLPGVGNYLVSIGLALFAFTTILGWSFYAEKCIQYLLGARAIFPFRILWILAVPVGATYSLNLVWSLADILNAMMAIPNLIALLLLSPVVFRLTREHFNQKLTRSEVSLSS